MAWSGSVYFKVWSPDFPRGELAELYHEDLGLTPRDHAVTLPPGRSYGRSLVIGPGADTAIKTAPVNKSNTDANGNPKT